MPYCPKCAVEVESHRSQCPLCGASTQTEQVTPQTHYRDEPDVVAEKPFSWPQFRDTFFKISTVLLSLPVFIVLMLDLIDLTLTWSLPTMCALIAIWFIEKEVLYQCSHPIRLTRRLFIVLALMLLILDSCDQSLEWFFPLGGPVVGLLALIFIPLTTLTCRGWLGPANAIGWFFIAMAGFFVALDALISHTLSGAFLPSWSVIVVACLLPIGLFMLYLHHRVRKHVDLKKLFHI
jgi:hypothetical protein